MKMNLEKRCDDEHFERWKEFEKTSGYDACQEEYCLNYCPIRDKDNCPQYIKMYLSYVDKRDEGKDGKYHK